MSTKSKSFKYNQVEKRASKIKYTGFSLILNYFLTFNELESDNC